MKHGLLFLVPALLLAACSTATPPDQIVLTRQSRESQDWGRFLPDLYGGVSACLAAHPAQPAFVTDAVPQNHGMVLVRLQGADGSHSDCSTGAGGNPAPKLAPAMPQATSGPSFTPATMPEPFLRCGKPEPVLSGNGRLLGWLTYINRDCPPAIAAADTGWRAFGNEPYWSLRIAGEDVVFDRLGEVPQRYAAKPATAGNKRMTWVLDPADGGARDRLEIVIRETDCGDTMVSRRYPYSAEIIFQGRTFRGCAEKTATIP